MADDKAYTKNKFVGGMMIESILKFLKSFNNKQDEKSVQADISNTSYWTNHNVTLHKEFSSRNKSLEYLNWRNSQYLFYEQFIPGDGYDGKVILDYGCGPGNDIVYFIEYSKPQKIIGMDVSPTSLKEAEKRMKLHNSNVAEFKLIKDGQNTLPIDDNSIDYIHSFGVLHHTPNIQEIMNEFNRILKPSGTARFMVYNYDSLWLHLYVAYQRRIIKYIDAGVSLAEAFKRSTDGEKCPISRCYKKGEFIDVCALGGFSGKFIGSAISLHEMSLLPLRYQALQDLRLEEEHRSFLKSLTFDKYGRPLWEGEVAGIDSFFEVHK